MVHNLRLMRAIDLKRFNVFDLDAHGSPWKQWLILLARRPMLPGERIAVILTEGTASKLISRTMDFGMAEAAAMSPIQYGASRRHDIIDRAISRGAARWQAKVTHRWQVDRKEGSNKEARAIAAEVLAKVGLSEKMDAYPSQLSGGQQQRVAIARSLAMRPKVLLCDEITSALDPELVNEVLRVVEQLAREGMTLILVTHEMRFARDVGTKLVFMHHGKVHEEGVPKDVFAAPRTPELQQFVGTVG